MPRKQESVLPMVIGVSAIVAITVVIVVAMIQKPVDVKEPLPKSPNTKDQPSQPSVIVINKDEAPTNNPFIYENERNLQNPPAKPFYHPTRGKPDSYQQYGVLIGEERRHRGEQTILPLIGRQTYPGSSRYHYYTSTNGYHPMKLPVVHKNRTCNDTTGCEEIFSGNLVSIKGYDYDFKADVYPSPDLQYIL